MDRTLAIFTCDVECSIGNSGTREHPIFRPWPLETWIWGRFGGDRKSWGIELLMDQLEERGARGTFYVSALERHFHGDDQLAEVARAVEDRGHEAGVHVHCAWSGFRPVSENGRGRRYDLSRGYHLRDSIGDHDEGGQRELLTDAIESLRRWTGRAPRSFRAGNFGANRTTLRLLAELGIETDSSRNAAVGSLDDLGIVNSVAEVETGLLEVPATSFEALGAPRPLVRFVDPTNMTLDEVRSVLDQVAKLELGALVLVTHSFQYLKPGHVPGELPWPRPRIVERVSSILDLIVDDERFEFATMRDVADRGLSGLRRGEGLPRNPAWMTAARLAQSATDGVLR